MATLQGGLLEPDLGVPEPDHGVLEPDLGVLSPALLAQLRDFKVQSRIANEKYLRTHKEVELLISSFFREMLLKRPENILEFAADYFTDPRLPRKIHMQLIKDKNVV
ncbi:RIIa domain-containing protein 1 [Eulemur rufifrons]|uniref:RIIa domain-containing protein 1 n=1 Tax=Eulemur rufifrons TaxID=859984 RepID=UPI0037441E0B